MYSEYPNISKEMSARGITYFDLAKPLGLSPMGVYRRLRGSTEWKLSEAILLCQYLGCNDINWLFVRIHSN